MNNFYKQLLLGLLPLLIGCSEKSSVFECNGSIGTALSETEESYKIVAERSVTFSYNCTTLSPGADCLVSIGDTNVKGLFSIGAMGRKNIANPLSDPAFLFYMDTSVLKFNLLNSDGSRGSNWFSGKCTKS